MEYPPAPIEPITQVETTIEVELVRRLLENHGCNVEGQGPACIVLFPEGTTQQELYPRTIASRFRILLPGGLG